VSKQRTKIADQPARGGQALAIKYRPSSLDDVVGQDAVVKSLRAAFKSKTRAHAYCFTGPSGCGKTTLARIVAAGLGVTPANLTEVDAASNSGIDAIKELVSGARYKSFGGEAKAYIIDEAHALSKQAWQALLKPMEEPPEHVYYFLCTTEAGKIPETITTRCQSYLLKSVRTADLLDLLDKVADAEQLDVTDSALKAIAEAAGGSPRQALTMLGSIDGLTDLDEIRRVLEAPAENAEVIDLCRRLLERRLTWEDLVKVLKDLGDMSPESIRIVIVNYLGACLLRARGKEVPRLLDTLAPFSKPFPTTDKMAPLLLAFGNLMYD
jgi:DNA polymerase-3 subunit gamma/tau